MTPLSVGIKPLISIKVIDLPNVSQPLYWTCQNLGIKHQSLHTKTKKDKNCVVGVTNVKLFSPKCTDI